MRILSLKRWENPICALGSLMAVSEYSHHYKMYILQDSSRRSLFFNKASKWENVPRWKWVPKWDIAPKWKTSIFPFWDVLPLFVSDLTRSPGLFCNIAPKWKTSIIPFWGPFPFWDIFTSWAIK